MAKIKITKREYDLYGYIEKVPLAGVRKVIATHLLNSVRSAPQFTHFDEADVTDLNEARKKAKHTMLPYIIKAAIAALKKNPTLNANFDEKTQTLIIKKYQNIGIAVDTEAGLMVPVIKIAQKKNLQAIAEEIAVLAAKAKDRKLDLAELKGGTFTVSNNGAVGGKFVTPILNHPEVAIIALGRMYDKPLAIDGKVEIRKVLPLSLTCDHRVIDGAGAARFTNDLKEFLENTAMLGKELD